MTIDKLKELQEKQDEIELFKSISFNRIVERDPFFEQVKEVIKTLREAHIAKLEKEFEQL